ncbi:dinitrogenase iron-molybdenum cofactor biosynthesis domain-containing protein [Desulfopila sp. IMCC35006]|uniref:NifB/NifX family molybdenum-iron cluster-binding protein n=1 Tax=Desulfopila sp. IMCC35006 TaxID=2569542 RepID=UPI0010ABD42C|nr:NifB/NifX family molybdenum-iron cluster-binding protein [Desulfopila sp. IMCC35006]TKB24015.1 dinitrogenase iron-molybdenum cofactor biosynthesis domain-containing protein [Desulfopila sp. IMCC35006]
MNVAITVWGNRISPVFDSAQTLLVAEIREKQIVDRKIQRFQATMFSRCLGLLQELDVRVLICGALCEGPVRLLEFHGVEVIPFVTGEVEEILACFVEGKDLKKFAMPGCGHARCCRWRNDLPLQQELKNNV